MFNPIQSITAIQGAGLYEIILDDEAADILGIDTSIITTSCELDSVTKSIRSDFAACYFDAHQE